MPRVAILQVTGEFVLNLCKPGRCVTEVIENAVPQGALLEGIRLTVTEAPFMGFYPAMELLLSSSEFEEVPDGAEPPFLPQPVFWNLERS